MPEISVISPVYGCESCLEQLAERVAAALRSVGRSHELLLIDDGSPDRAWHRIVELAGYRPEVIGYRLSRNFGQHAAISAGLTHARGSVMVVMDCDLQDLPEEIPALLRAIDEGAEIALGRRVHRQDGWTKRMGSTAFYAILKQLTETDYDPTVANFGAYTRKVVNVINTMPESDRFFPLLVRWTGFPAHGVPVRHASRIHGRSGYSLGMLLRLAVNVSLSYSDKPLRLVVKASAGLALLAVAVALFSIYRYLAGDIQVAGFTSVIASIWLVGSAILSSVGVLGLYLGRLYNQAKGRPHYVLAERIGHSA